MIEEPVAENGPMPHDGKVSFFLPPAPASERGPVKIWEEPVEILTYEAGTPDPNPVFLEKRVYQGSSGRIYPLPVIDRIETTPVLRKWRAIHLENQYLRVMVLPEIGGRIHVAMDKRTGYDFVYRQNVIKPALVGLAGPWVSGGIEFNWPQHHRPATFMPVEVSLERRGTDSAIIWCSDHDPMERMKGMHGVCLHNARAYMEVMVRLYNRTTETRTFLWWSNVAAHVHGRYQSFFPKDVSFVADHAKRAISSYPLSNGTYYGINYGTRVESGIPPDEMPSKNIPDGSCAPNDLGWYANIPVPTSYMVANSLGDFSGGYDHTRGEGIVAIADHHTQPGKKQWTWGNHEFGYAWDRSLTDSDGPYIELMVGAYTDNQPDFSFLAPAETKTFSQYWYPISEIGVPDIANLHIALRLEQQDGRTIVHLFSTENREGCVVTLEVDGDVLARWSGELRVENSLHIAFDVATAHLSVAVEVRHGATLLLRHEPAQLEPVPPPEIAEEPCNPEEMCSSDDLYLTGLHLEQYRHPTRSPEPYWREALKRDPGDSRCNLAMGKLKRRRGEFAESEEFLRSSLSRLQKRNPNPADGEAHYELGLTLQLQGKLASAYAAFFKATWNAAWAGPGYHRLAEIDCIGENWPAALDHVDRSLLKSGDNLAALGLKALVLRRLGRFSEADGCLSTASQLDPLDIWSRYLKSGVCPSDGQLTLDLCFDLLRAGFQREVYELLQQALERDSARPDGSRTLHLYLLATTARQLGLATEADEIGGKARRASTRYVFPHRLEELNLLEEALRYDQTDARAHLYLGNLLYDKRRHQEALHHWEQAVALDDSLALGWRNIGIGDYNVRRDGVSALAAFAKARQNAEGDARLLYEQDQLCKRVGQTPRMRLSNLEADWPLVLTRDDLSTEAATVLNSLGRPEEALNLLLSRKFQPWEGGEGAVLGQYMRANLLLAVQAISEGELSTAETRLHAALHPPESLSEARHVLQNISILHYWLGACYAKMGREIQARHSWERASASRTDFNQMRVEPISSATYWSALALRHLGREQEAEILLRDIRVFADRLQTEPAKIDFFATSLPNMLLFEDDIDRRQKIEGLYLSAQAAIGLRGGDGYGMLEQVLDQDRNHAGALDLLWMRGR